jgi:hypothetical protein
MSDGMSDGDVPGSAGPPELIRPDRVDPGTPDGTDEPAEEASEFVSEPAKVMRVGSMIKQLLDEVRTTQLDEPGRERLRAIYQTSIEELGSALSPDLQDELNRLALPFDGDGVPSDVELRLAQAQLVGWLEGLFHGIQATLFAQQMAARQQLENMRGQLPPGAAPRAGRIEDRPGTYL